MKRAGLKAFSALLRDPNVIFLKYKIGYWLKTQHKAVVKSKGKVKNIEEGRRAVCWDYCGRGGNE